MKISQNYIYMINKNLNSPKVYLLNCSNNFIYILEDDLYVEFICRMNSKEKNSQFDNIFNDIGVFCDG